MTVEALAGPDERLPDEAAGAGQGAAALGADRAADSALWSQARTALRPRARSTLRTAPSGCG